MNLFATFVRRGAIGIVGACAAGAVVAGALRGTGSGSSSKNGMSSCPVVMGRNVVIRFRKTRHDVLLSFPVIANSGRSTVDLVARQGLVIKGIDRKSVV